MHHEPRLDPGYLGCDRTQGARGLLALERAELCVRRGGAQNRLPRRGRDQRPQVVQPDESKQSAGKNTSPNVITTTFVTCLVYLNMYTLLDYKKRVERSKRGSSPALPLFTFDEPVAAKAGATASCDR